MRPSFGRGLVAAAALLSGVLAACGGDDGDVDVCRGRRTVPEAPVAPALQKSLPQYVNKAASFYDEVQAMAASGDYPGLADDLADLAATPVATWLAEAYTDPTAAADYVDAVLDAADAADQRRVPVFVTYNIPGLDVPGTGGAGLHDEAAYQAWTQAVSDAIGARPAVIVLEPDALAFMQDQRMRSAMAGQRRGIMRGALRTYKVNNPGTQVYVDGGHPQWLSAPQLANELARLDDGTGLVGAVALNVANFRPEDELETYAKEVNRYYCGKLRFLFDVSRNGNDTDPPAPGTWCDPPAARLGKLPDARFSGKDDIEYVFVKPPGESDGTGPECPAENLPEGRFNPRVLASLLGR